MIAPAIPIDDVERINALHEFSILDTLPEDRFDRLTHIAMTALETPMASVSLIDKNRQWCKSSHGLGTEDVARSISFWGHTILQKEPVVVNDTLLDRRFHDNPVVTNTPHIRAYLGIPLFSEEGFCIGSLCVVDTRKRRFTSNQISVMRDLAVVVQNEITNFALNESLQEARSARRAAEAADRAKSKFLAVMSHEIRTPLNGIIGITDLLAATELNPSQQEYVNIVHSSGSTLLALINDILDFSKIEAGKLELENAPIEIRRFLKETLAIHFHVAQANGVNLKSEIGKKVPVVTSGDIFRLRQVLLNLVGNALKFTKEGEIKVAVDLETLTGPEPLLNFRVIDTGAGISPEGQAGLFQAFSQADSSISRNYGGTGLGLAVCKQLVELMGGRIWVESILGKGSVFAFSIPLKECGAGSSAVESEVGLTAKLPRIDVLGRQLNVLVVDDNSINQRVASLLLDKLGCRAESASSGADCLEKLESTNYDIILMDMEMPEMSGCETTHHIRLRSIFDHAKSRPWIVAVTANVGKQTSIQCAEAGMDDYMTKPLRLERLRIAFERFEHSLYR